MKVRLTIAALLGFARADMLTSTYGYYILRQPKEGMQACSARCPSEKRKE